MAIGTNMCVASSFRYFVHFHLRRMYRCSAGFKCRGLKMKRCICVRNRDVPCQSFASRPGNYVAPSGRLPFCMMSPVGSLCVGISTRLIALHMMSLIIEWRSWRGVDRLYDRPCRPLASTALPHAQV